jgi:uncharacterized protein (TIGR02147 family)
MHAREVPRTAAPEVFRYQDFRAFLRDHYSHRKAGRGGFSLRAFSRRAALRSPNYLKLVMDGDRNLTAEMAARFAAACGLEGEAAEYFCALVGFNQARTSKERELHYGQLRRFARYRKIHTLDAANDAYHAHWYVPAIRELVARADFDPDPRWIARTLTPSISPSQARRALEVLLELSLLRRDEVSGRYEQVEPLVESPAGPLGHHMVRFHRAMMALAADALDHVPRDEREIASLTLCLSEAQMRDLKLELSELRRDLLVRYATPPDATRVVQLNLQMFPLSRAKE